jgi:arylsulfatase A-like enzyme
VCGWVCILSVLAGCGAPAGDDSPNVLLITIDTLRADHMGTYGHDVPTTPAVDRLAAEGATFEHAYSPMGTTSPAHATLFTARQPLAHGLVRNGLTLLEEETTLAEILTDHGYQTAGFVSAFPVSQRFGFGQGFEIFDDHFEGSKPTFLIDNWAGIDVGGAFDRRGVVTTDAAVAWLEGRGDPRSLFLWVHLFDPHSPYSAPPGFVRTAFADYSGEPSSYDAEIRYADEQVSRLVAAFEAVSPVSTLIVVASDHGEGLLDHGWPFHNRYLYEEEVRIPLIFRWPGRIPAGLRLAQPAHLVDVLPTLTALLGISHDEREPGDGMDLSPFLARERRPAPDLERVLWFQRPYYTRDAPKPYRSPELVTDGYGFGLRRGRWKYMERPRVAQHELYDLEEDAKEQRNLAPGSPRRVRRLSRLLGEWRRQQLGAASDRMDEAQPGDTDALRALGYVE